MPPPNLPPVGRSVKVAIPLLMVIAGLGIGASQLNGQLQRVKQQLLRSQQDVAQLTSEKETLLQQVNDLQTQHKGLEDRVSSLRSQLSSVTTDLEHARASLQDVQDRYEKATQERDQLQSQVSSTIQERDDARKQLTQLQQEHQGTQRALSRVQERLKLLDRDYRQLSDQLAQLKAAPNSSLSVISSIGPTPSPDSSSDRSAPSPSMIPGTVELPPIVVHKDQAMMAMPIRGRLREVNALHNFAIIDKGSTDGVRIGMVFDIMRGATVVGRATVIRVRPQLAACDILRSQTPDPLEVGDLAVQGGS